MLQISVRKVSNIIFRNENGGFVRRHDSQNKGRPSPHQTGPKWNVGAARKRHDGLPACSEEGNNLGPSKDILILNAVLLLRHLICGGRERCVL